MHFRKFILVTVVTADSKLERTGNRSKERDCTGLKCSCFYRRLNVTIS